MRYTEPLSDANMAAVPPEWLVVYLHRKGSREVKQQDKVVRILRQMFSRGRVQVVKSTTGFKDGECGGWGGGLRSQSIIMLRVTISF